MLIPNLPKGGDQETYEGAIVIDPEIGYYKSPIATLDFASLYPSIMMAHNLCYSTLIPPHALEDFKANGLKESEYERTPNGDYFVRTETKKGLLPIILEELIAARKKAKADLKVSKDEFEKAVLNGR